MAKKKEELGKSEIRYKVQNSGVVRTLTLREEEIIIATYKELRYVTKTAKELGYTEPLVREVLDCHDIPRSIEGKGSLYKRVNEAAKKRSLESDLLEGWP